MLLISKNLQLSKNELSQIEKLAPAFFKHLDDQGFNPSRRAARNYFLKRVDAYAIYMLRDCLKKGGALKNASAFLQYSNHPLYGSVPQDRRLHMDYLQGYDIPCLIAMLEETEKEQVRALRFIAGNLDKAILTSNTESGFKPDGSGYHHHKLIYTYMQSALLTLSKIAYSFSGSSFALSKDTLSLLKKAALSACFYSNNSWLPLVMHGRMVFSYRKNKVSRNSHYARTLQLPEILKNLALAVGEANNVDKELAQAYVNLAPEDKAFAEKYQLHPGMPPQGNLSMPYGQLVAHRRDNWLALAYGYGKYTTSVEIYPGINRFGRYTANATLDIISDKGVNGSGSKVDGWDWNRMNGATVIYQSIDKLRPPHRGYFTIRNPYGFYGGISWRKSNGCFAMQIHGDVYDSSFRGKKTYFMFDERIYALGSNIQCANKQDPVQTNLFQKALETKDEALYVDGEKITTFPVADKALDIAKAHHLIDPVGNGYFVPAKQKLFYARKTQQSRDPVDKKDTSGDFATAWIDHGTAPKDAGYEYVVMPYCDQKSFDKFSASDYQVLQRDNKAHIVFDKASNSYGSIFFAAQNPTKMPHVQAVARNCMIISKKVNGELQLAVGDPDVNRERGKKGQYLGSKLNPLKVTFAGAWKLKAPVKGVKIISSGNDKTIIEFACIDGKSFDFTLIK